MGLKRRCWPWGQAIHLVWLCAVLVPACSLDCPEGLEEFENLVCLNQTEVDSIVDMCQATPPSGLCSDGADIFDETDCLISEFKSRGYPNLLIQRILYNEAYVLATPCYVANFSMFSTAVQSNCTPLCTQDSCLTVMDVHHCVMKEFLTVCPTDVNVIVNYTVILEAENTCPAQPQECDGYIDVVIGCTSCMDGEYKPYGTNMYGTCLLCPSDLTTMPAEYYGDLKDCPGRDEIYEDMCAAQVSQQREDCGDPSFDDNSNGEARCNAKDCCWTPGELNVKWCYHLRPMAQGCAPEDCKNGSCIETITGKKCICDPRYTGETCENPIDICEIHDGIYGLEVCANGGSCENDGDGYKCNCLTGYGGRYCELMFCEEQGPIESGYWTDPGPFTAGMTRRYTCEGGRVPLHYPAQALCMATDDGSSVWSTDEAACLLSSVGTSPGHWITASDFKFTATFVGTVTLVEGEGLNLQASLVEAEPPLSVTKITSVAAESQNTIVEVRLHEAQGMEVLVNGSVWDEEMQYEGINFLVQENSVTVTLQPDPSMGICGPAVINVTNVEETLSVRSSLSSCFEGQTEGLFGSFDITEDHLKVKDGPLDFDKTDLRAPLIANYYALSWVTDEYLASNPVFNDSSYSGPLINDGRLEELAGDYEIDPDCKPCVFDTYVGWNDSIWLATAEIRDMTAAVETVTCEEFSVANGQVSPSEGPYRVWSKVRVTCEPGYGVLGSRVFSECRPNGRWQPRAIVCRDLYEEGLCDMNGEPTTECGSPGISAEVCTNNTRCCYNTDSAPHWCHYKRLRTCDAPVPDVNGMLNPMQVAPFHVGDTSSYVQCESGYELDGNGQLICTFAGWVTSECIITCGKPNIPLNIDILSAEKEVYRAGDTFVYKCADGYANYLLDDITIECLSDGTWEDSPKCKVQYCHSNPCLNGGVCFEDFDDYSCHCTDDFNGDLCENEITACIPNPCQNNGSCEITQDNIGYACECVDGFTGSTCSTHAVNASYTDLKTIDQIRSKLANFCTEAKKRFQGILSEIRRTGGGIADEEVLESLTRADQLALAYLGIENANVRVERKCYEAHADIAKAINAVSDAINRQNFSIEDNTAAMGRQMASTDRQNDLLQKQNRTTEQLMTLITSQQQSITIHTTTLQQCICMILDKEENNGQAPGPCYEEPCLNSGTCEEENGNAVCTCAPAYVGTLCENVKDPCDDLPCQNGGSCTPSGPFDYDCECVSPYAGKNCTEEEDGCTPKPDPPCQNGATCMPGDTPDNYTCSCGPNFAGQQCSRRLDPCEAMNPCQNGGNCIPSGSNYTCECVGKYTGRHCTQAQLACSVNPCKNDGDCTETPEDYNCTCGPRFEGKDCEIMKDLCKEANVTCLNGGTCKGFIEGEQPQTECECTEPYIGEMCEERSSVCDGSPCVNGICGYTLDFINYRCDCDPGFIGRNCTIRETQPDPGDEDEDNLRRILMPVVIGLAVLILLALLLCALVWCGCCVYCCGSTENGKEFDVIADTATYEYKQLPVNTAANSTVSSVSMVGATAYQPRYNNGQMFDVYI